MWEEGGGAVAPAPPPNPPPPQAKTSGAVRFFLPLLPTNTLAANPPPPQWLSSPLYLPQLPHRRHCAAHSKPAAVPQPPPSAARVLPSRPQAPPPPRQASALADAKARSHEQMPTAAPIAALAAPHRGWRGGAWHSAQRQRWGLGLRLEAHRDRTRQGKVSAQGLVSTFAQRSHRAAPPHRLEGWQMFPPVQIIPPPLARAPERMHHTSPRSYCSTA